MKSLDSEILRKKSYSVEIQHTSLWWQSAFFGDSDLSLNSVSIDHFNMLTDSFTAYWSQGQTVHYVLVDIAQPPMGTLSLSNLYIALSRSSGWDTIWLLWDFNKQHFQRSTPISWMKMTGWKKWIESQRIGGQGWEGPKLVVTSRLHTSMSMLAMAV